MASGFWCYITKNIPLFSLISQTYTVHTFDHILYVYGISYTVHIWSHWSKLITDVFVYTEGFFGKLFRQLYKMYVLKQHLYNPLNTIVSLTVSFLIKRKCNIAHW